MTQHHASGGDGDVRASLTLGTRAGYDDLRCGLLYPTNKGGMQDGSPVGMHT